MPKEFPGASYDNWKTTDPRDYEPEEEPEPEEPEQYECDCCGKMRDTDEIEEKYNLFGSEMICDRCVERGDWPPEREYEPE